MGRPPANGGPAFRFNPSEVAEMEAILLEHNNKIPNRELFETLARKFSNGPERFGRSIVHMKQVWNWFQNKRYALKAKSSKVPANIDVAPLQSLPPLPPLPPAQAPALQSIPPVRQEVNEKALSNLEFEARSAKDGAWYDVAAFLSVKNKDTDDPEVLVRFLGLPPEEDEWVKVSKHVRHRSLPCEASECVAVLPGDLILCFQEAPEQALYFDAHVLDAQRLKHDSRGCRCRFLVSYDHDQFEEVVPLRKICRRPETDYRLQIYEALHDVPAQQKKIDESFPCSAPVGCTSQAESFPMNEKASQQNTTGLLEDANAAAKKARVSEEEENREAEKGNTPARLEAGKEDDVLQHSAL